MKIREKNPPLKKLIEAIDKAGIEKGSDAWRAVAEGLNRPRRKGYKVNLFGLEKAAKDKESVVVPGVVLGSGKLTKAVTVAALKFTPSARKAIEAAGGKCLSLTEMAEANPKGSKLRIMG